MEFPHFDLSLLHDATLALLKSDGASVTLDFRASHGSVRLRCESVSELVFPFEEPWGHSLSVNSVEFVDSVLRIEMQSGDAMTIRAAKVEICDV